MKAEKIRVLFLGEMISSHAQSWMGLLDYAPGEFRILGFGVPNSPYPAQSPYKNFGGKFVTSPIVPAFVRAILLHLVIRIFRPDIIHSFGAFPAAALYAPVITKYRKNTKWVMQVRGGPDVFINHRDKIKGAVLQDLFAKCDVLIADNHINYDIARQLGIAPDKCWTYGIAPGTGGVDPSEFQDAAAPTRSQRQVIWPKAYEGMESKGLPVVEAIRLAWPKIVGTKFIFTAADHHIQQAVSQLPEDIKSHIEIHRRIPRAEMLRLMKQSRVVMAPSLLEGIPNALYEAMAAQCVPVFSPLPTYQDIFIQDQNILYAANLNPEEIAASLIRALTDDELADKIAAANKVLVAQIANRRKIADNLIRLYRDLKAARKET